MTHRNKKAGFNETICYGCVDDNSFKTFDNLNIVLKPATPEQLSNNSNGQNEPQKGSLKTINESNQFSFDRDEEAKEKEIQLIIKEVSKQYEITFEFNQQMRIPLTLIQDLDSVFEITVFQPENQLISPDRSLGTYDYDPKLNFKATLDDSIS